MREKEKKIKTEATSNVIKEWVNKVKHEERPVHVIKKEKKITSEKNDSKNSLSLYLIYKLLW